MVSGSTQILEVATMVYADYHTISRELQGLALLSIEVTLQNIAKVITIFQVIRNIIHILKA